MKKLFFFLAVAIVAFLGSCEKDTAGSVSSFTFTVDASTFTVDASALPTATNFLVSLVPSEETSIAFSDEFKINEAKGEVFAEKNTLCADAYFSVIAFDSDGRYISQNFFPFTEQTLILSPEE